MTAVNPAKAKPLRQGTRARVGPVAKEVRHGELPTVDGEAPEGLAAAYTATHAGSDLTAGTTRLRRAPRMKKGTTKPQRPVKPRSPRAVSADKKSIVPADPCVVTGAQSDTFPSDGALDKPLTPPAPTPSGGALLTEPNAAAAAQEPTGSAQVTEPKAAAAAAAAPWTASSLFFSSGVVTGLDRTAVPPAELAASPLRASSSPYEHYVERVKEFVVNPFNGRRILVHSPAMRQLESLGFRRDAANQLHLTWSPEAYFCRFHKTLRLIQQRRLRELHRRQPETRKSEQAAVRRRGGRIPRQAIVDAACAEDVSTEDVLSVMLQHFESPSASRWRAQVAELLRRRDALTAIPQHLSALYDQLTSAYMPPKLDTTPDPSIKDVVLTLDQENVASLALRGYSLYVGGSAGTGKTVLVKAIYRQLSQLGLRVAVTATTGVAAVQLGGCTLHRAFSVPVETTSLSVRRRPWDYNALRAVDVLIVDEISLLSAQMVDALDMEARLARMHDAPFGGIQVIFCGDFLQLASQATADDLPAYQSEAFRHLLRLKLVTPMRHVEGDPLLTLLHELRRGRCDKELMAALNRAIPADASEVTYVFPRRRDAQQLNEAKLSELQTAEMVCTPQRGPLELVGTFTCTGLLSFRQSTLPLPSRAAILEMVKEETAAALAGAASRGGGGDPANTDPDPNPGLLFKELVDHDIVLMPTRTTAPGLALRLRVHVDPLEALARREAVRRAKLFKSGDANGQTTPARSRAEPPYPAPFLGGLQAPSATTPVQAVSLVMPSRLPLSPSAHMLNHPDVWAEVVARVAQRLGGTVVGMFEVEPPELVPLSVTTALADPSDGDIAESLQPLRLKLGARVMVNRNLSRTVSNGSVGVVEAFAAPDYRLFPRQTDMSSRAFYQRALGRRLFDQLPVVRLLSGEVVQIPPLPLMVGGTPQTYYYGHEVYTLPLQLGYGFTVHKVQGLTLHGTVVLDCAHFFECPHLIYVACSRVRSLDQLVVWNLKPEMIIVKKSALDFSDSLQEAKDPMVLAVPPEMPRAAWTLRLSPRVYSL